jgi:general secretion pathway protein I
MKSFTHHRGPGFTLLEVMVAIAILASGILVLLQVQTRSIQMAQDARYLTVATQLARAKFYDCKQDFFKKGFSVGDYNEAGNFDEEGFPQFFWECHAYKFDMPIPSGQQAVEAMSGEEDAGGLAGLGMGMLAPFVGQLGQILGDSIKEMVVIVRWQDGNVRDEIRVVSHVVDKSGVSNLAAMMGGGMTGGASGATSPGGTSGLPVFNPGGTGGQPTTGARPNPAAQPPSGGSEGKSPSGGSGDKK